MNIEEQIKLEEKNVLRIMKDMGDAEKKSYAKGYTDAMLYAMDLGTTLGEHARSKIRELTLKRLSEDERYKNRRYYASHEGQYFGLSKDSEEKKRKFHEKFGFRAPR